MKQGKRINVFILSAISLLLMISCATTKLSSVWRDESYSGKIKKVFIIGASPKPDIRRLFESKFADQLKYRGLDAVASDQVLPSDKMLDKETIVSKIKGLDIDTVLITRLTGKKVVTTSADWYGNYSGGFRGDFRRDLRGDFGEGFSKTTFKDELVSLETNLYEVRTEKLIWSVSSETLFMEERSIYKIIKSLVKVMATQLSKEKFIKTGK